HAPNGLPGDPTFLIRRDHIHSQPRPIYTDFCCATWRNSNRSSVEVAVELQTAPLQVPTDPLPNLRCVFSDPASEDDGIRAIQHGKVGAEILAHPITEQINGELRPFVMLLLGHAKQLPHVV